MLGKMKKPEDINDSFYNTAPKLAGLSMNLIGRVFKCVIYVELLL